MSSALQDDASSLLSSLSDVEFSDNLPSPSRDASMSPGSGDLESPPSGVALHPAKRRRVNQKSGHIHNDSPASSIIYPIPAAPDAINDESEDVFLSEISSDSSNSVPGSPRALNSLLGMPDDDAIGRELVQVCMWEGCDAGDCGNQDNLVEHVIGEHVGTIKRTRYTCEWADCRAKGKAQLSAYALRAHMRSHTKEKPFFCTLPECDRSFTRSDALTKHMRTVHESESIRLPEQTGKDRKRGASPGSVIAISPPPQSSGKPAHRLKLVLSSSKASNNEKEKDKFNITDSPSTAAPQSPVLPADRDAVFGRFPQDVSARFRDNEGSLPRDELYRLLRRQIAWATQETMDLERENNASEELRRQEFMAKELVLENLLESEFNRCEQRDMKKQVESPGIFDIDAFQEKHRENQKARKMRKGMLKTASQSARLPMVGRTVPWYRRSPEKQDEEVLGLLQSKAAAIEVDGLKVSKPVSIPSQPSSEDGSSASDQDQDLDSDQEKTKIMQSIQNKLDKLQQQLLLG